MYETHGIDLTQVLAATQTTVTPTTAQAAPVVQQEKPPKKKIPNLVKISDVLNVRKQLPQENYGNYCLTEMLLLIFFIIFFSLKICFGKLFVLVFL